MELRAKTESENEGGDEAIVGGLIAARDQPIIELSSSAQLQPK